MQQKLYDSCMEQLKPMAKELRAAGWSDRRLQGVIRFHLKAKLRQYYEDRKGLSQLTDIDLESLRNKDSKAEAVFYEILKGSDIKFQFQYKIGPYRADYLVGENLVVELDGPQHKRKENIEHDTRRDAYMVGKGYHILRLDLDLVAMDPQAAIQGIKELTGCATT
jgi:very-short-patch-repair endonuclease